MIRVLVSTSASRRLVAANKMRILVLSTWFPYAPDNGAKIRAYHLIRELAVVHDVALVSFADASVEPGALAHMQRICRQVTVVEQQPFGHHSSGKLRSHLSLRPASVVRIYSPEMSSAVRKAAYDFAPQIVLALTFVTAPYALELQ